MQNNQKYLLPNGFYDLLGDEAKINHQITNIFLDNFFAAKYQLIKTPLVEFADENNCQKDNNFKIIDNISGKSLIIRDDITPQIARLVATKLKDSKMPLKLCYIGDVLKTINSDLYNDRQLTQAGIELIGEDSCSSNLEIIDLTISSLKKAKLSNLIINFCYPQFLDILLKALNVSTIEELKNAIINKNISAIKELADQYKDELISLILTNKDFDKITAIINKLPIDENIKKQLLKWQETIQKTKKNHPEIDFLIDIFGDEEFFYHQQIGFTIFTKDFSYPIARGGRYKINQNIPAIGSTIYINYLRKILGK